MTRDEVLQKFEDMGLIRAEDVEYQCWITPNRSHIINMDHDTENWISPGGGILIQHMDESSMGRWQTYEEGLEKIKDIIRHTIDP